MYNLTEKMIGLKNHETSYCEKKVLHNLHSATNNCVRKMFVRLGTSKKISCKEFAQKNNNKNPEFNFGYF